MGDERLPEKPARPPHEERSKRKSTRRYESPPFPDPDHLGVESPVEDG